jgi:subtilisin family serine protease
VNTAANAHTFSTNNISTNQTLALTATIPARSLPQPVPRDSGDSPGDTPRCRSRLLFACTWALIAPDALAQVGVSPHFGCIANFQILGEGISGSCAPDPSGETDLIASQASQNIQISNNSLGEFDAETFRPITDYIALSRAYGIGVRDADPGAAGNQPITFVFAAGNSGKPASIVAPGNAKNVITVGASENQHPSDEDGPWQETSRCASPKVRRRRY